MNEMKQIEEVFPLTVVHQMAPKTQRHRQGAGGGRGAKQTTFFTYFYIYLALRINYMHHFGVKNSTIIWERGTRGRVPFPHPIPIDLGGRYFVLEHVSLPQEIIFCPHA